MRRCAVFTLTHNEKTFLPIWVSYYSKYFDGSDIYVIDHDSIDGSIKNAFSVSEFKTISVSHPKVHDNSFMINTIKKYQRRLLEDYEYVLYSDADELVIVDPETKMDLREFIEMTEYPDVMCSTRSPIHMPWETPINFYRPILDQRQIWVEEPLWNKVLLSNHPLNWTHGLHYVEEAPNIRAKTVYVPSLYLIHLHRIDWDTCVEKRELTRLESFGGEETDAWHILLKGDDLRDWFYFDRRKFGDIDLLAESIPERFKSLPL